MPCRRVWEDGTFQSSGGEGYFDHELVRAAARGEYDEVEKPMEHLTGLKADPGASFSGSGAGSGALRMTGGVRWKTQDNYSRIDRTTHVTLKAASMGGKESVVLRLLDTHKVDVNAPTVLQNGRTALQAAAEGGHEKIVQLLSDHKADVNGPAARLSGRTALQAAAEGGHEKIVQLLLGHKADVNAPAAWDGKTALQAAERCGEVKVLLLILLAGTNLHEQGGNKGQNFIHYACGTGRKDLLSILLEKESTLQTLNARDSSGSTPLHIAVRNNQPASVELLLEKGANKEIQDTSGNTPLAVALAMGHSDIFRLLLEKGASTDTIVTSKYVKSLKVPKDGSDHDSILISDHTVQGRAISATSWHEQEIQWDSPHLTTRSIIFQWSEPRPSNQYESPPSLSNAAAKPSLYLGSLGYRDLGPDSGSSVIRWMWSPWEQSQRSPPDTLQFTTGIPNNQEILSLSPTSVIVVGYVCFVWPSQKPATAAAASPVSGHPISAVPPYAFKSGAQKVEIS